MAFSYHQQPASVSSTEQLRCSACKINVLPNERNTHYRSDWHRYNVKRKCVNMEPIEKCLFEEKLKSIIASGQKMDAISNKKKKKALNKTIQENYNTLINNDQWNEWNEYPQSNIINKSTSTSLLNYKCTLCSKTFKTHQQCLSHLNTKKHKLEFIKYHKNLRDQQQEEINVFQATNAGQQENAENNAESMPSIDNLIPLNKLKPMITIQNNPFITIKKNIINHKKRAFSSKNDDESKEGGTDQENDNNDDNDNDERIAINPYKTCLFCTESFESDDLSQLHMNEEHGFFIPLPLRLKDDKLSELLQSAGRIIGEYHQCVWCWKIFKSLRGVQSHMRFKGHCKLQIEYSSNITYSDKLNKSIINENDESPFLRYFDFDKIINDDDDLNNDERQIMIAQKRHITDINDYDELVRNDGTVIGHRDNLIVYKQKHKNLTSYHETQSEEQIIAQINNPQRKLKLEEIERQKNAAAFEKSGAKQQHKHQKVKQKEAMRLQTRAEKVSYQNWVNLQKSKQLY